MINLNLSWWRIAAAVIAVIGLTLITIYIANVISEKIRKRRAAKKLEKDKISSKVNLHQALIDGTNVRIKAIEEAIDDIYSKLEANTNTSEAHINALTEAVTKNLCDMIAQEIVKAFTSAVWGPEKTKEDYLK